MTIEEAFGLTIRELRKTKILSQEALSDLSGLDRSYISQLECGKKQPSLITIFQLASAFNISAASIISMVEEKIPSK
jgi:transcriptional regulator with XRE-family HTH domain